MHLPRPLRPTNRRSLNLATWFFMTAEQLRSSPHQLSSLPARIVTIVPSPTSLRATTLNATGRVLLERQWLGRAEHRMYGLPVRTEMCLNMKNTVSFECERCNTARVNANVFGVSRKLLSRMTMMCNDNFQPEYIKWPKLEQNCNQAEEITAKRHIFRAPSPFHRKENEAQESEKH